MSIYDRISPFYDLLTISERPFRRQALNLLAVKAEETLLEIGCGTAGALLQLAPHMGDAGRLIGLDLSPGMLAQAQHNVAQNQDSAVILLRGSGLEIPLAADCCDACFLSFTLELFDLQQQHTLLSEVRRVLKEDGRLALVTLSSQEKTVPMSIYWSLHEVIPSVVDCCPLNSVPLLSAAGFTVTFQDQQRMFGLPMSILLATAAAASGDLPAAGQSLKD